jgi:hypothetical protein
MLEIERQRQVFQTQRLMNELEELLLKKGWPVPLTPYYLVHHEHMLTVLDQLRLSLQDELDARFIQAFGPRDITHTSRKASNGKER